MGIRHRKVATAPDNPNSEVSSGEWNDDHVATGTPGQILGYDASGNLADLDPAGGSVATRTALASADTGSAWYLTESGREGMFVFDSSDLSAYVTADPQQGIYVAPASDTDGSSGAWVRKFDGLANSMWWGEVADNSTNDQPALQAALDTLDALANSNIEYGYGYGNPGLFIPQRRNHRYLASSLTIYRTMKVVFDNGAGATGAGATLHFGPGTSGLLVQAGCHIQNPMVIGSYSGTEGEYHGIEIRGQCTIDHAFVKNFPGDGIYGNSGLYPCNSAILNHPTVTGCRDGIYFYASDANALSINDPQILVNRRWGIQLADTIGQSTIKGGTYESNGWGTSMCYASGKRYRVLPGAEAGASTNAPSGTTAHNAWWAYLDTTAAAEGLWPTWTTGQTWRAGGVMYLSGESNFNSVFGGYWEADQAPAIAGNNCNFFGFYATTETGSPYPAFGANSTTALIRRLRVGSDLEPDKSLCRLDVDGQIAAGDIISTTSYITTAGVVSSANMSAPGLVLGTEVAGHVTGGVHKMQINATGTTTPLMISGGSGEIEIWKDTTPSKAICIGMAISGGSLTNDLLFGNYDGASWSETARLVSSTKGLTLQGPLLFGATTAFNSSGVLQAAAFPAQTGDVTNSAGSLATTISNGAVTLAKMANMATASVFYRKTAGTGAPEVQTLATLKTDLGLAGTNSGDQTSIVGISGTLAQFNTACSDADFASGGGTATGTNTGDQTITLTSDVTGSGTGSFATTIANNAVSFAKFVAAGSAGFVGATGAGNYSHRTPTQVTAALDSLVGDSGSGGTKGLAPAPSAGDAAARKYLKADGTWAVIVPNYGMIATISTGAFLN